MSRRLDGEVASEIRHPHDYDPTNPGLLISIGEDSPESSAAVRSSAVVREVPDPAAGLRGYHLCRAANVPVAMQCAGVIGASYLGKLEVASAELDVTDSEPLPKGHPLWSRNVIITPHSAGQASGGTRSSARTSTGSPRARSCCTSLTRGSAIEMQHDGGGPRPRSCFSRKWRDARRKISGFRRLPRSLMGE